MKQLIALMAEVMPEGELIDLLDQAIKEYQKDPTPEMFSKVGSVAMIVMVKTTLNVNKIGADQLINGMSNLKHSTPTSETTAP